MPLTMLKRCDICTQIFRNCFFFLFFFGVSSSFTLAGLYCSQIIYSFITLPIIRYKVNSSPIMKILPSSGIIFLRWYWYNIKLWSNNWLCSVNPPTPSNSLSGFLGDKWSYNVYCTYKYIKVYLTIGVLSLHKVGGFSGACPINPN